MVAAKSSRAGDHRSNQPLTIDRDAVKLVTFKGKRDRIPGGAASMYVVEPGGMHDVNCPFDATYVVGAVESSRAPRLRLLGVAPVVGSRA